MCLTLVHNEILKSFHQLGRWKFSFEIPDAEDILANPLYLNFSSEVDAALTPSLSILTQLLEDPDNVNS